MRDRLYFRTLTRCFRAAEADSAAKQRAVHSGFACKHLACRSASDHRFQVAGEPKHPTGRYREALARRSVRGLCLWSWAGARVIVDLQVHEEPRLSVRSDAVLQPGHVVTIEPGLYIPGWGGIRLEDMVLVTKTGHEVLTSFPKDLRII